MLKKTCKTHGELSPDQISVHKRARGQELECRLCVNARMNKHYHAHPEKAQARNKAKYEDPAKRAKILGYMRGRYRSDPERFIKEEQDRKLRVKIEVLRHYSGGDPRCKACGEAEVRFLGLDHVNGDGAKQRREASSALVRHSFSWAKAHGFPADLQVLCHNCNLKRHISANAGKSASARSLRRLKEKVLGHYSGGSPKCSLCDVVDLDVLTIDHMNGGGSKHKRQVGNLYRHLRDSDFPDGFRVLCFNHNLGAHCVGV